MNLLLTSNFPLKNNGLIVDQIRRVAKNPGILFIAYNKNAEKYCKNIRNYNFETIDFMNISKNYNSKQLSKYDVLVMHGGIPASIKETLIQTGFADYLSGTEQLIVATSGSSCVLSKQFTLITGFYPGWKSDDTSGLCFFPYEIIPHYDRYKKHRAKISEYSKKEKIYIIPDGSALSYIQSKITIIGNAETM